MNPTQLPRGLFVLTLLAATVAARAADPGPVDFNRDIRPILSERCYQCHGPDAGKRKADLRLDTKDGLFREARGVRNLVPGRPEESEIYIRIGSEDEELRMPPRKAGKALSPEAAAVIRRWIEEGASWKGHWAYLPIARPPLTRKPEGREPRSNPIDLFLDSGIAAARITPAPEADRATLIRRLSFDLVGLPPTPAEVDAFVADRRQGAYGRLVERLLASPHFGERMALFWLDQVRYADTTGYHSDNHVDLYLFRDYVIRAFNENLPFDRFTIEQLAGDLIPAASDRTRIASGYNRLLQTTQEGGGQAKEYLAKYSADRVRNASSVWLGATMGCAECHDHKYDPFTTRDFYRFAAFFADLKETAVGVQEPTRFPSQAHAEALRRLDDRRARLVELLNKTTPELEADQSAWEKTLQASAPSGGTTKAVPKAILNIVKVPPARRTADQVKLLAEHHRTIAPRLEPFRAEINALQKEREVIDRAVPTSLVSAAVRPRVIRLLPRGNWLDESGPEVTPEVPAFLPPLGVQGRRASRLDLARWLVARDNPLTARVMVNRLWKLAFGQGLVTSLDDFGSQGALPTHPELLDWLASEFRDTGWDVKRTVRLMVTSRAYRRSSVVPEADRQRDPANRWLARQNRFRLDAELLRDNALAISGLLSPRIGGPSVKPYQPPGYWAFLNFPIRDYVPDKGDSQYRRGLYTYWQRTFLHPSLLAFDASTREECVVQRARSNTPVQALVVLNDPTYVEAARAFAARLLREGGNDPVSRLSLAYRLALGRPPQEEEGAVLLKLLHDHREQYESDPGAARELVAVGDAPPPRDVDLAELAAWTSVTRVLLNLHETITRN
jgi:hypothetical protein